MQARHGAINAQYIHAAEMGWQYKEGNFLPQTNGRRMTNG